MPWRSPRVVSTRKLARSGQHFIEQLKDLALGADELSDVEVVCGGVVFGFAYELAALPILQVNVRGVVGDLPMRNRLARKNTIAVFGLPRTHAPNFETFALQSLGNRVVGDLAVARILHKAHFAGLDVVGGSPHGLRRTAGQNRR